MTQALDVAARFDRISEVYDETREPLTPEAVDKLAAVLSRDGVKRVLEVGVGTGRIAEPLQQRRVDVVGVDLSRGMLSMARAKGLKRLVMADADHLPFGSKAFDAVLMAHVLHLLENPAKTFKKVARTARKEVVVILRKRDDAAAPGDEGRLIWQAFRKALEEIGFVFPQPSGGWRERFRKETEFVSSYPPGELLTIQDSTVVTTLGERLSYFEKRSYEFPSDIPDDVFLQAMKKVRSSVDPTKEISYRRVEQLGVWRLDHDR